MRAIKANRFGVGLLYAVNTFGAVVGAAATGFVLIPSFGMRVTTGVAAAINILLGVVAIRLSSADRSEPAAVPTLEDEEQVGAVEVRVEKPGVRARAALAASSIKSAYASLASQVAALVALGPRFVALSYEVMEPVLALFSRSFRCTLSA